MNTTTTIEPILVGYSAQIKQDQELYTALQHAVVELEQLVEQHGLSPARRELNWASSSSPGQVIAHLIERDEYGSRQANTTARRSWWLDPVSRLQVMISLLLSVRGERWRAVHKSIERGIDQLEREEQLNAKPD